jgi:hypothetical protein
VVAPPARFPIRFSGPNKGMAMLGIDPHACRVEVDEGQLSVYLGWAFRLRAPLADVRSAEPDPDRVWGWGAHGWRGTWLVNGSSSGLVRITLDPPAHAHTAGVPVTVRVLRVSVDDPDALVEALRHAREGYASA